MKFFLAHIELKENYRSYIFMKKENEFSSLFGHNIISNGLYQTNRINIVAKNTTEPAFLFHKKTTKLVLLWLNMGQKSIKVLNHELCCIMQLTGLKLLYGCQVYNTTIPGRLKKELNSIHRKDIRLHTGIL